mgnify:CR=1 FL=1
MLEGDDTIIGGKGATVSMRYAEALYTGPNGNEKGHRDEVAIKAALRAGACHDFHGFDLAAAACAHHLARDAFDSREAAGNVGNDDRELVAKDGKMRLALPARGFVVLRRVPHEG